MANPDSPFGLRLDNSAGQCSYLNEYTIASGYNTGIGEGDPVKLSGTVNNIIVSPAEDADTIGVFVGCMYVNPQGKQVFASAWPDDQVATEIRAFVIDDPKFQFIMQADVFAAEDVGLFADWDDGAVDPATGLRTQALVAPAAGADKVLRIIGLAPLPKNEVGAHAKVLVKFAKHAGAVA